MPKKTLRIGLSLVIVVLTIVLPAACVPAQSPIQIFSALKSLELPGKLVFILYRPQGNQLIELDLGTGSFRSLFDTPSRGYIGAADISPDKKQIVMSYAPPPEKYGTQVGSTDLYLINLNENTAPRQLTNHQSTSEIFGNPTWSPDGQYIYYTHYVPMNDPAGNNVPRIERMKPGGQPQVLYDQAEWAALSPDGSEIAFLTKGTGGIGSLALRIGAADGSSSTQALPDGMFPFVDAHFFAPDNKALVFSSSSDAFAGSEIPFQVAETKGWLLSLTPPVIAHPQPSDWYEVNLVDRQIKRLASMKDTNLYGAFSPDHQWIAFISQHGVYAMKSDGSSLTQIASLIGMGSMTWIP